MLESLLEVGRVEKPYGSSDGDSKAHSSCAAEFIPMSS